MQRNQQAESICGTVVLLLVLCNAVVLEHGLVAGGVWYKLLFVTLPLLLLSIIAFRKKIF